MSEYGKAYYRRNKEYWQTWGRENARKPEVVARRKELNAAIRERVVDAYGGACSCCGETMREFLTIDHIFGSKGKHRKSGGRSGSAKDVTGNPLYRWLEKNNYPKDEFRLLCYNCNSGRRLGPCPHELQRLKQVNT